MITPTVSWPTPTGTAHTMTTDVQKVPPIGAALQQLETELHYIRETVLQLEQRLGPALRPIPVQDKANLPNGPIGGSPMVNHIESLIHFARSTGAEFRALIDCLEI